MARPSAANPRIFKMMKIFKDEDLQDDVEDLEDEDLMKMNRGPA
jgi:hypothetical protein